MILVPESQFYCVYLQDVFPLQPFEKDDQPVLDQSEKDDACDKLENFEKTPRKMLSRGEVIDLCCFIMLFFNLFWYWICVGETHL